MSYGQVATLGWMGIAQTTASTASLAGNNKEILVTFNKEGVH